MVTDQRIRHDNQLAGIRRIGADLLVAGLAGVNDEISTGARRSAERDTGKGRAVGEREERGAVMPDPRVDHRLRRRQGRAGQRHQCHASD